MSEDHDDENSEAAGPSRRGFLQMGAAAAAGLAVAGGIAGPVDAATRQPLKVSIANIGGDRTPPLWRIIDSQRPHVYIISEAYRAHSHLRTVARNKGYRLRELTGTYEAKGVCALVRNDVTLDDTRWLRMSEHWWWNGNRRAPRTYPVVRVRFQGQPWDVIGVHYPPGGPGGGGSHTGGRNGPAWHESKRAVQRWAANHPHRPVLAAGDFNAYADECRHQFPGFNVARGQKVDHAISKKYRGARLAWVRRHNNWTGHGWVTFKYKA